MMLPVPTASATLPRAIWMPGTTDLPSCYQGSPVEMVEAMAQEMKPGLGGHDAIDRLLHTLGESRRVKIRLPEGPLDRRAASFVVALLVSGIARPMPSA